MQHSLNLAPKTKSREFSLETQISLCLTSLPETHHHLGDVLIHVYLLFSDKPQKKPVFVTHLVNGLTVIHLNHSNHHQGVFTVDLIQVLTKEDHSSEVAAIFTW